MATITDQEINDLVVSTLKDLGRMKFQQIAQSLTRYEIFSSWFTKDKVTFSDGIGIQKTLMNRIPDVARHVGWAAQDLPNIEDLLVQMNVPWRQATTNWSYKHQELLINRGASQIVNLIKSRRAGAMLSMVEVLEEAGWTSPSSSSDETAPYGIPYWVVKNASTGFTGGAPSGHTTVGGIDPATNTTWKNYAGLYATVSKADLIKKMRTMKRKTDFVSPVDVPDYMNGNGKTYRVYTNESVMSDFEDVGEAQNENLGRDIASIDGVSLAFRGHPIRYVPQLDSDTTNPVYFVNHATFYPCVLAGDFLRENAPKEASEMHNWYTVYVDLTYNYCCVDRRRNGVLATST